MIRDTAAVVAGAALMPDTLMARGRDKLWLTFVPCKIMREGITLDAETDNVPFNL
jgi:hypothetical protein